MLPNGHKRSKSHSEARKNGVAPMTPTKSGGKQVPLNGFSTPRSRVRTPTAPESSSQGTPESPRKGRPSPFMSANGSPSVRNRHRRASSFNSLNSGRSRTSTHESNCGASSHTGCTSDDETQQDTIFNPSSLAPAQDWHVGGGIYVDGHVFRDPFGRTVQLRGVNLCGNSKLPTTPHADNPEHEEFFDTHSVSFVNRPFPLAEADEHFGRLSHWGLTFVRLLVPWEALEHAGPGQYDEEYIEYLISLCEIMPKYGIKCFIDPHQDVWSRFSGGSGAPGWSFEVAGLDIRKFKSTGAAHVHNAHKDGRCDCKVDPDTGVYRPKPESSVKSFAGNPLPMLWPSNYTKLASATMFTLFFAGATFAPSHMVDGENIQHYLQRHYMGAYKYLASRLKHLDAVIGFELMNEPHQGYIGLKDLNFFDPTEALVLGDSPSALQSFCLGMGLEQDIEVWVKSWPLPSRKDGTRMLNTERERVWLPGYNCPWMNEGIYKIEDGKGVLLKPDYFTKHPKTGAHMDFNQDFYLQFAVMYANSIHQEFPEALVLVEPIPQELPPVFTQQVQNLVYAPHWYDLKSVFNKSFNSFITHDVAALRISRNVLTSTYFGLQGAKKNYRNQLAKIRQAGLDRVGQVPCVVGECGIPMDLNSRTAFDTGNYEHHNNFLDAVISAMEANLVHFTLWNYNPGNDNAHGDYWNGEDFSIFSPRQQMQYNIKSEERRNRRKDKFKKTLVVDTQPKRNPLKEPKQITEKDLLLPGDLPSPGPLISPVTPHTPFDITELFFNDDMQHHVGGRVLDAVIRPYAARIAGTPVHMEFDLKTLSFRLEFVSHQVKLQKEPGTAAYFKWLPSELPAECYETVIFVPKYHYGYESVVITVSDGTWAYYKGEQSLFWRIFDPAPGVTHWIQITVKSSDKRRCCPMPLDGACTIS